MRRSVCCAALGLLLLATSPAVSQTSTEAILDSIQHTAFNFFWNEASSGTGLIRDRSLVTGGTGGEYIPSSVASVGFGLSAICVGVDHGWVTRSNAAARVLTTFQTLWQGPQGNTDSLTGRIGLFYHMLDMTTARRAWSSELSSIDTGLLLAGIIDARQYFDGTDSTEQLVRNYADSIYQRMNWNRMRNYHDGILMGWMPGTGYAGYGEWTGYCEAMVMYILAMGSPTYPVDSSAWVKWVSTYDWHTEYGYQYVVFAPLFGHQYSHCWIDFRGIQDAYMRDKGIDYFENSRRATLAQRAYAIDNPGGHTGYSDSLWGLTASDIPTGYGARGAPPAQDDDGTITPTAPISSIAFAPDEVIPVIRNLWENYHSKVWTPYGFRDAFNLDQSWYDTDIVGIDQGPEILMIENYLNGRVWKRFMQSDAVQRGLAVAGFKATAEGVQTTSSSLPSTFALQQNYPNPFNPATRIEYTLPSRSNVQIRVYDLLGREVAVLVNGEREAGTHAVQFDARKLSSGIYFYRMNAGQFVQTRSMMVVK